MKNIKIIVKTKSKSYPIYIGNKIINDANILIKKNLPNVKKIFIICDKNVPLKYLQKLKISLKKYKPNILRISSSEKIKNFAVAHKIIEKLLHNNFNRSDCIVSLGGGIVGDLSAFVSSLTKRGMKFINIPSTLLAQVDASIGGKTAVNSTQGKNLIGSFYQPDFVLMDISLLQSLPKREIICGYAEVLKHALILDKKFFIWLNKNAKKIINGNNKNLLKIAIQKSCNIKSKIISKDEKEKNVRMVLNFGHTFAHALEGASKYSKRINHGEAVLIGMMLASELSYKKELLSFGELKQIKNHYNLLNLPNNIKKLFKKKEISKIIYFMKKDKKNFNEKINLILINKIGKVTRPNSFFIRANELKKFLNSCYN